MSNSDVLNDNIRLIRLLRRVEEQRDDLLVALELAVANSSDKGFEVVWGVRAQAAIAKAKGGS